MRLGPSHIGPRLRNIALRARIRSRKTARRLKRTSDYAYRWLTANSRVLPDFLIIGAMRCGTTSLHTYLASQPMIVAATTKEVHYFDLNYNHGPSWYRRRFPRRHEMQRPQLCGEASPYYIFHPQVPARVKVLLPEAKLIALLRNPVDRTYSHYKFNLRARWESLPFQEALESEAERLRGEEEKLVRGGDGGKSFAYLHFSYLARSRYAEQLERWLVQFPREQMLIIKSESLFSEPAPVLQNVSDFLGVPLDTGATFPEVNTREREPMEMGTRKWLEDYFRPYNEELRELIGPEFTW